MKSYYCNIYVILMITFTSIHYTTQAQYLITYSQQFFGGNISLGTLNILDDKSYYLQNKQNEATDSLNKIDNNGDEIHVHATITDGTNLIYINKYSDPLLYSREIRFSSNVSWIKEKKSDLKWQLSDSTRKIGDYLCNYASCEFRGRKYNVWYTTDIPLSVGPWKLRGLPGLILDVSDDDNMVMFSAVKIEKTNSNPLNIQIPKEKLIDFKDYFNSREKDINELKKKIISKAPKGFTVTVNSIKPNYIETAL